MEKYNTLGYRFVALIIDTLVMIPIGIIVSLSAFTAQVHPRISVLVGSLTSVITVFYYIFMHAYYGQTVGKMAMKLKVLDVSERPITLTQAVIRSLPQMLPVFISASDSIAAMSASPENMPSRSFLTIAIMIAYISYFVWSIADIIVCLASEKKRSLHDLIAGTVVVKTNV